MSCKVYRKIKQRVRICWQILASRGNSRHCTKPCICVLKLTRFDKRPLFSGLIICTALPFLSGSDSSQNGINKHPRSIYVPFLFALYSLCACVCVYSYPPPCLCRVRVMGLRDLERLSTLFLVFFLTIEAFYKYLPCGLICFVNT